MKKIIVLICMIFILVSCGENKIIDNNIEVKIEEKEKSKENKEVKENKKIEIKKQIDKDEQIENQKTLFRLQEILGQIEIKSVEGISLEALLSNTEKYEINGSRILIGNINFNVLGMDYINNNLFLGINGYKYQLMFKFTEDGKNKEFIVSYPFKEVEKKDSFFPNKDNVINKIINKNIENSKIELGKNNDIKKGGDSKRFVDLDKIKGILESNYNEIGEYSSNLNDLNEILPKDIIEGQIINGCKFGYNYEVFDISMVPNQGYRLSTCLEEKGNIDKAKEDGGIYDDKYEIFKDTF